MGSLGVEEGDPGPAGAVPRRLVNEPDALFLQLRQGGVNVVHPDGDVLNALAVLLNEAGDGALRGGTLQQLQLTVAAGQERNSSWTTSVPLLCRPSVSSYHFTEAARSLTAIPT